MWPFKKKKDDDHILGNTQASFIKGERAGKLKHNAGLNPHDLEHEPGKSFPWLLGWLFGFNESEKDDYSNQ